MNLYRLCLVLTCTPKVYFKSILTSVGLRASVKWFLLPLFIIVIDCCVSRHADLNLLCIRKKHDIWSYLQSKYFFILKYTVVMKDLVFSIAMLYIL